jgi:hypothetical protein
VSLSEGSSQENYADWTASAPSVRAKGTLSVQMSRKTPFRKNLPDRNLELSPHARNGARPPPVVGDGDEMMGEKISIRLLLGPAELPVSVT